MVIIIVGRNISSCEDILSTRWSLLLLKLIRWLNSGLLPMLLLLRLIFRLSTYSTWWWSTNSLINLDSCLTSYINPWQLCLRWICKYTLSRSWRRPCPNEIIIIILTKFCCFSYLRCLIILQILIRLKTCSRLWLYVVISMNIINTLISNIYFWVIFCLIFIVKNYSICSIN